MYAPAFLASMISLLQRLLYALTVDKETCDCATSDLIVAIRALLFTELAYLQHSYIQDRTGRPQVHHPCRHGFLTL
jgi:hypothetical protein